MLQKLFELFRSLLFLVRDVEKNKSDIADLQREVKDLSDELVELRSEMRRGFDNERNEHEKFILKVENVLLRFERSLTAGRSKKRR